VLRFGMHLGMLALYSMSTASYPQERKSGRCRVSVEVQVQVNVNWRKERTTSSNSESLKTHSLTFPLGIHLMKPSSYDGL
jgi:hypothetical protein